MLVNKRRSLLSTIVPALAATLALGNSVALGGHRGHRSDCECQQAHVQAVPCDPCQTAPNNPLAEPIPQDMPIADPVPQDISPAPIPEAVADAIPQAMDTSTGSDFNDFDLSTGLTSNFGGGGGSSLAFSEAATPGYIESARIQSRVRLRYDNMQGANAPTRAQFLYPSLGVFGGDGPPAGGIGGITEVDLEQVSTYIELAFRERFSVFIDVPIRWIGPIDFNGAAGFQNGTQRGAGDISTGFRWGMINCPDEHLTFQMRTTLPTGEPLRAVGTGNTTIDFSLLYDQRLNSKTWLYAELNDWQTLDAVSLDPGAISNANLASQDANILRAGLGLGYELYRCGSRCNPRKVTLLTEIVTWTVLDGVTTSLDPTDNTVVDATGDTIVNGKYGVRFSNDKHSVYVGYGHNWTSDRWYSDLLRLEYQRTF